MGLISRSVERLEDSLALLSEVMATFAVNKGRLEWTGDELRQLYSFYEQSWKPRYDDINGLVAGADKRGGA